MQRDMHKLKIQEAKQRQLEETNRQMRLRIQVRGEGMVCDGEKVVCGGVPLKREWCDGKGVVCGGV